MKTIGIFSSLGIGDIIVLGPLVKKLKSIYPESEISVISMRPGYLQGLAVTKELFYIDKIIILNRIQEFLRIFPRRADLFIFLGYYSKLSGFLKVFLYHSLFFILRSNKKIKYNELETPDFKGVNMVEIKLNILKKLGINLSNEDYELFLPFSFEEETKEMEELLKKSNITQKDFLVTIHLGTKEKYFTRFWPFERWVETINYLKQNYNAKIIFIGGKNDIKETEKVIKELKFSSLNFIGELSIKQTSALIDKCSLFISTNSGPMWIAAALHKPQIALCGPSKFAWDPYNKKALVIRKIINRKHCNPPCDAKICHYKDNLCMKSITTKYILNIIDSLIINISKDKNVSKLNGGY